MNHLTERVAQFAEGARILTDWLGSGAITVDPATAQRRADICLKCPMNANESFTAEAIAAAVRKQVEIKNHLQLRVGGEKNLKICSGCGCVLRLKVWLPTERLGLDDEELKKFPDFCWMQSEFKNLKK